MKRLAAAVAVAWFTMMPLGAQAPSGAAPASTPRTPWGHPDLQGIWTNWDETPYQAPDPNAKPEPPRRGDPDPERSVDLPPQGGEIAGGMATVQFGPVSKRRPGALVVDPPNGRVPVIPGKRVGEASLRQLGDHWTNHSIWQRCISRGVPGRMLSGGLGGYNRAYRILQTPTHVVIFNEEIHETRFVPVDGRAHVGSTLRLWNGDSRGRWEGQTLVVETTNFNDKGQGNGGARQTEALRLVERFTRADAKTLTYEVTFEDPNVYSRPWTGRQPHNLHTEYTIHEYACHEGNWRYMEGVLEQGRLRDAAAAGPATKK